MDIKVITASTVSISEVTLQAIFYSSTVSKRISWPKRFSLQIPVLSKIGYTPAFVQGVLPETIN
jgi:hypothetical protein